MSNQPEYKYNGLRNLLLPQYPLPTHRKLCSVLGNDKFIHAIKSFSDNQILIIYHEPNNKYRDKYTDEYVNCTFHTGYLEDIADEGIIMKTGNGNEKGSRIPLNTLLDVIPAANLKEDGSRELKLFSFNSIDPKKPADMYNIIGYDPARAFMDAHVKSWQPLYLSSIEKLHDGMQFNKVDGKYQWNE